MFKFLSKHFIVGLMTILPVVLTVYLLYWVAVSSEAMLGNLLRLVLPDDAYRPGMGVVAGIVIIFLVGLLMHLYVFQALFAKGEQIFYRLPLVKSVYPAIRDFFDYFSPKTKKEFEQVVSVSIGDTGMQVIGFVTQADMERMPDGFRQEDSVLVYIPLSYMIGGYAVLMPRSALRPLDMNMEEAMRFALTAGVTGSGSASAASKKEKH